MADRQAFRTSVDVKPRFRCLVCQRFVEGTAHGTCPRCGWQPPVLAPVAAPRARRPWTLYVLVALAVLAATLTMLAARPAP